jgi:transcriptional regulator with XRE-family HTH domain
MTTKTMKKLNSIVGSVLTLGKALKAIRLCDEISQGEFAKQLHVTQSYLSDLEHDRKEISPQKAAEFAKVLKQSEKQFVRLALQDILYRRGLKYEIQLHEAA